MIKYDKPSKIIKIISGGQTGADIGGLKAGCKLLIETGGIAPKGYRTEKGCNDQLRDVYGLIEHSSSSYIPRTIRNVRDSTFTVILGNTKSTGSKLTISACEKNKIPYFTSEKMELSDVEKLTEILMDMSDFIILNVAGNRESVNRGIEKKVISFVESLILSVNGE